MLCANPARSLSDKPSSLPDLLPSLLPSLSLSLLSPSLPSLLFSCVFSGILPACSRLDFSAATNSFHTLSCFKVYLGGECAWPPI